jgi:hypothetical protein
VRGHVNEARVLISDRQLSKRPRKIDWATRQRTALSFNGIHRKFFDVGRYNAHVKELTLQCFPGVVEHIQTVVTSH